MLGAASGAVAGLVAVTPACGYVGPVGALVLGLLAGVVCLWGVSGLKKLLGADDALDVFGVHGTGGILGALLTGVLAAPGLGGQGIFDYVTNRAAPDYSIGQQFLVQATGVGVTLVWSVDRRGDLVRRRQHRDRPARDRGRRARRPRHLVARRVGVPLVGSRSGGRRDDPRREPP